MTSLSLREVNIDNWREASQLNVKPEQLHFVADLAPIALVGLAKAYLRPGGLIWTPYAIDADDEMVGFLMLAVAPDSTDDYWVFHFFIDQRYQGRGHGKQALNALVELVKQRFPHCRQLSLTVHPENVVAQRLYQGAGFLRTAEERFGEDVYRLRL